MVGDWETIVVVVAVGPPDSVGVTGTVIVFVTRTEVGTDTGVEVDFVTQVVDFEVAVVCWAAVVCAALVLVLADALALADTLAPALALLVSSPNVELVVVALSLVAEAVAVTPAVAAAG